MRKNIKKILVTSMATVLLTSTIAMTASNITKKKIEATYGKVKFNYNGADITSQVESKYGTPGFISGGRTYVPVRALADVLGVNVDWNSGTDTVMINSNNTNEALLRQQINMKDIEIARLNEELRKEKDGTSSSTGKSMRDIESDLIKDYGDYKDIDFRIDLRGDKRSIDLEVEVNLRNSREKDRWDDLSERDVERFIEDMVRDVQREYRDADVKGYIRDTDAREDLYTFEKRGTRSIDIRRKGKSDASTSDMERDLEKEFDEIDRKYSIRSIKVKEDSRDKYEIYIKANMKEKDATYDVLSSFYKDVRSFVEDEYRDAKVKRIEIQDTSGDYLDHKTY